MNRGESESEGLIKMVEGRESFKSKCVYVEIEIEITTNI